MCLHTYITKSFSIFFTQVYFLNLQLVLFTHIRLAYYFSQWADRVQLIQARLQALSILVYANAIQDNTQQLLYNGLMEELVDVLELDKPYLTDIKAAALKTLTSIIHLDRAQNFPRFVEKNFCSRRYVTRHLITRSRFRRDGRAVTLIPWSIILQIFSIILFFQLLSV